ncbi:MAG: hypothetical protein KIT84_16475 [Labilithrix sp.]|nr:hypothetical protein [Labilithrix sp.]MCW5812626.1 hypothetical protein [Labilithrix sp.]
MGSILLGAMWLVPIVVGVLIGMLSPSRATARAVAIAVAACLVPAAFVVFISSAPDILTASSMRAFAVGALAVDGLSAVLVPLVACLALGLLVALPRTDLDASSTRSLLVVLGSTFGVLVSANVLLLGAFWTLSLLPLATEAQREHDPALARATRWAAVLCIAPMLGALALIVTTATTGRFAAPFDVGAIAEAGVARPRARVIAPLILLACTARMGIFPFHSWVPVALGRGRLAVMIPSVVSPLGSFALVRLGVGLFPVEIHRWCDVLATLATISALYGAFLGVGQTHARRQLGFLWTSTAGFVLAGVATLDAGGLSGALIHDLALTVAMTGLALLVRAVEARTGTADFRRLGGLVVHAPRMATGYFLLGLAAIGFPATVAFVSEDLVIQGLARTRPAVAVLLLISIAVNGLTLVRSFKRIFLGPPSPLRGENRRIPDLLLRERWVGIALVVALLAGGLVPAPLIAIRRQLEDEPALAQSVNGSSRSDFGSRSARTASQRTSDPSASSRHAPSVSGSEATITTRAPASSSSK